jgi:hypothetical protein
MFLSRRPTGAVADIAVDEDVPRVILEIGQGVPVPGIGQQVERDHAVARAQAPADQVGADEPGPAGNQYRPVHAVRPSFLGRPIIDIARCIGVSIGLSPPGFKPVYALSAWKACGIGG